MNFLEPKSIRLSQPVPSEPTILADRSLASVSRGTLVLLSLSLLYPLTAAAMHRREVEGNTKCVCVCVCAYARTGVSTHTCTHAPKGMV